MASLFDLTFALNNKPETAQSAPQARLLGPIREWI
jgi:hypothetical protein